MKVFVTGGTGLIGRALVKGMLSDGYEVTVLTRQSLESYGRLQYVQSLSDIPEGLDAVVNLAGAGLADKRWSEGYKREILDSRITLTRDLVDQLSVKGMPKVFEIVEAIEAMERPAVETVPVADAVADEVVQLVVEPVLTRPRRRGGPPMAVLAERNHA